MWFGSNEGTGDGAYDADESALAREGLSEVRKLFLASKAVAFTRKNYPGEPMHVLHQNTQMAAGLSTAERKALAQGHYAHAKAARVGDKVVCAGCGAEMAKASYQHAFCKDKVRGRSTCKDFVNNWLDATRLARATANPTVK